jgi:hypothetical protein
MASTVRECGGRFIWFIGFDAVSKQSFGQMGYKPILPLGY